jgi:hypothetical protein
MIFQVSITSGNVAKNKGLFGSHSYSVSLGKLELHSWRFTNTLCRPFKMRC